MPYNFKIDQPSTNCQHPQIVTDRCQPTTHQILENRQAEGVYKIGKTSFVRSQQSTKSRKRTRGMYIEQQVATLEEKFVNDPYPSNSQLAEIAEMWGFKTEQIKFWF